MCFTGRQFLMLKIERALEATPEIVSLIEGLEAELAPFYEPEQRHGLSLEALFKPHIRFFVATNDSVPVGCGGVGFFDGYAEVKRMFVRPTARGAGVAEAIVERIQQECREAGQPNLLLETGIHQHAALRFYERVGFERCGAFGPYALLAPEVAATSVFFGMRLD